MVNARAWDPFAPHVPKVDDDVDDAAVPEETETPDASVELASPEGGEMPPESAQETSGEVLPTEASDDALAAALARLDAVRKEQS